MNAELERQYLRAARDWLVSRWMLMGNYIGKYFSHPSMAEWQMMELDCGLEMRLIIQEARAEAE